MQAYKLQDILCRASDKERRTAVKENSDLFPFVSHLSRTKLWGRQIFKLTFILPLGCSSSVTDTLSCCSRLFTSLEQQTLTAPCTCDALYSENVLLSITSKRPVPLWMRLARRLMSMVLRFVGPFSPAMMSGRGAVVPLGQRWRCGWGAVQEEGRDGQKKAGSEDKRDHWGRCWEIHAAWGKKRKYLSENNKTFKWILERHYCFCRCSSTWYGWLSNAIHMTTWTKLAGMKSNTMFQIGCQNFRF